MIWHAESEPLLPLWRGEDIDEKTAAFIDWAKKKVDWFDPSVARIDEILGDRDHKESEDRKSLKKRYY